MIKRCENACRHHSQMVSNLLQMIALQSRQQVQRIYVLSRTTTRKKLLAYLESLSEELHSQEDPASHVLHRAGPVPQCGPKRHDERNEEPGERGNAGKEWAERSV